VLLAVGYWLLASEGVNVDQTPHRQALIYDPRALHGYFGMNAQTSQRRLSSCSRVVYGPGIG
jgi:hypothetical protein